MIRTRVFLALAVTVMVLSSIGASISQTPTPAPAFKSVEYLLLGDATRGAGEPMIAVDPTNPKNIIATAMGSLTELPPPPPGGMPGTQSIPRSTITWLAVTHDGGMTWKIGELPIMSGSTLTRCPDAIADVTKEGVFLAGCEPRETVGQQNGMSALVASTDKGETWGPLVEIISSWGAARFAPGLKPRLAGSSAWDRPYTFIDDSTGVIYGVAQGGTAQIDTDPAKSRNQSYITASTDGGRSFGIIYAWDSNDYPQVSRGAGVTSANGTVAVLYTASKVPARESANCPCQVFGLSRDQGKTFSYRVLKNIPASVSPDLAVPAPEAAPGARGAAPAAGPAGRGAAPGGGAVAGAPGGRNPAQPAGTENCLTADPTKPGRYAIRIFIGGDKPEWQVTVSEDYGETWSSPVRAGLIPGAIGYTKSAFEYSREGVLGFMWKAVYADRSFDVWCSISRDGGKTFSSPLQVNHSKSPGSLAVKGTGNDDISDLSMDKENIHMIWGDFRSGFMASWYGRVPITAFEFPLR
jgi:hypothetical protein